MPDLDITIKKAAKEFLVYYEQNRQELTQQHRSDEYAFDIFPPEFWSESDIQCWFREWFLNSLNKADFTVHTEVTINDTLFDKKRIDSFNKEIESKRASRADLAIFPRNFKGGETDSSANLFAEFKFVTDIDRPLKIDVDFVLKKGKGKEWQMNVEIYRIKKALDLKLTETGLVFCVHDVLEDFSSTNKMEYKAIEVPEYPNLHVVILERL